MSTIVLIDFDSFSIFLEKKKTAMSLATFYALQIKAVDSVSALKEFLDSWGGHRKVRIF